MMAGDCGRLEFVSCPCPASRLPRRGFAAIPFGDTGSDEYRRSAEVAALARSSGRCPAAEVATGDRLAGTIPARLPAAPRL